jgi:hypothetical protein
VNPHPYLRAFLGGAFVPTVVLPLALTAFVIFRVVLRAPFPIERGLVFPMALVPSIFGLWNMLWLGTHARTHLPLGAHGALLPLVLMPCGAWLASCLGILAIGGHGVVWFAVVRLPYSLLAPAYLAVLAGYYLAWKYVVGFLNRTLGIA